MCFLWNDRSNYANKYRHNVRMQRNYYRIDSMTTRATVKTMAKFATANICNNNNNNKTIRTKIMRRQKREKIRKKELKKTFLKIMIDLSMTVLFSLANTHRQCLESKLHKMKSIFWLGVAIAHCLIFARLMPMLLLLMLLVSSCFSSC